MNIYFGVSKQKVCETTVVKKVKPENVLLSYYYWKRKNLKKWIDKINYKPNIIIDSGAYSAFNKDKNLNILNYIDYIKENIDLINHYINLDVIGKPDISYKYYEIMKLEGLNPIPVYHYGDSIKYLKKYISAGNKYIALGNTAKKFIHNKSKIARWINNIIIKFSDIKFHLLGSTSEKIIRGCPRLYSTDSSSWITKAINGKPKHIKTETKRAKYNMEEIIKINQKPKYKEYAQLSLFSDTA